MIATKSASAATLLLLALPPFVARAQSPGETGSVAEALFRDAVALFDHGRVHEACEKFAESFRIDPANGTLQDLAVCHEREGKIASAWAEFAQLAGRAAQAEQREREQMARAHARQLEPRLTRVSLRFDAASNVERVVVDGQELGRAAWTSPLPLDPGEHAFVFAAQGMKSATVTLRVDSEGKQPSLAVPTLDAEPPPPPPRPAFAPPIDEGTPGRRTAALVVLGVGVLALGAGTYFGVATIGKKNERDARCAGRICDAAGIDLQNQARTDATVSTIAFGVGLAALGAATVLWLTSRPASDGARRASAMVRVMPEALRGGAGVSAELTW